MSFIEVIDQVAALLQTRGRLTYRVLKREFELDDEQVEDLKEELIEGQRVAIDENGKVLVWVGDGAAPPQPAPPQPQSQTPASYTPQHLADRIRAEQQAMESRGAVDGERKTITALFADLKGSTALIEGLDPEEARAIIDPALQLMMDAVHRYDGYVAQSLGDGIFALFGAPIAHEDHPQRALYAALRMQEEMRSYSDQSRLKGGTPLQMRVGINTGEVVVRSIRKDDLHTDYVPVGHSTNMAARMEQIATPGSIVISEYTRKLTEGYFELKALGAADIKGREEPLNVYEVVGAGQLRTKLQFAARRGLTRFVGRHSEMDHLQQALEQAKTGYGQIVGVMGEPGLGKSRLFHEFKLTSRSGCLVLEAFAVSHGQSSPYLPLIELLKEYFQIEPTDNERQRRAKVMGQVLALNKSLEATLPYLLALLGIEEEDSSLQQMDAQVRRQRTFDALKKLFLCESLNQPLILVFEDLHWIDSETQGFLDTLSESVASAQLLLLTNYRPEYRHEWGGKTYYTQLRLAPLGKAEAEEFLTVLLGSDASLMSLKELILERTDSTPFFMEEVVQTLSEEGRLVGERGNYHLERALTELQISPTVQGVLAARIDRLTPEEKTLLQQLAVIGRQFPLSLVQQVVSQSEDELDRIMASLQAKDFLYEQAAFPESEYIFKHALTQNVAYGTVLQEHRKALHERTGKALETLSQDSVEEHYSELARHYSQSGNTRKAVEYLRRAGKQAVQHSANADAIAHLTSALELLKTVPNTRERAQQELALHVTLGSVLITAKGWAAPEVEHIYSRVRALCQQVEETPQLFSALSGLGAFYIVREELRKAQELHTQLFALAQNVQDPALFLGAHLLRGYDQYLLGEFRSAQAHLVQSFSLYDPQQGRSLAFRYGGSDPGMNSLFLGAFTLWMLGYPDQALKKGDEALALAQTLALPHNLAHALSSAAELHAFRREARAAWEQAEAVITLATEYGFPFWLNRGIIIRGWALSEQGQGEEGIAQLCKGLAAYRATGAELFRSFHRAWLAETYGKVGQPVEGLAVAAEALDWARRDESRYYDAELYRLKGELTFQKAKDLGEVEAHFLTSLDVARSQDAKSMELRAATSLARLWQGQGKTNEARELLAPVYDWFTEGFDTADLKDAKALLDELT